VSAETEIGEIHLLAGRHADAIAMYEAALESGRPIGLVPVARAALQRRIAIAYSLAGDPAEAALAAEAAAELYAQAGATGGATRARIDAATALVPVPITARSPSSTCSKPHVRCVPAMPRARSSSRSMHAVRRSKVARCCRTSPRRSRSRICSTTRAIASVHMRRSRSAG
jgi:hypothetical protein